MKNREKNWKFSKNEENCKKSKPRMYKVTGKTRCHQNTKLILAIFRISRVRCFPIETYKFFEYDK